LKNKKSVIGLSVRRMKPFKCKTLKRYPQINRAAVFNGKFQQLTDLKISVHLALEQTESLIISHAF
jgi:hypothetical protein